MAPFATSISNLPKTFKHEFHSRLSILVEERFSCIRLEIGDNVCDWLYRLGSNIASVAAVDNRLLAKTGTNDARKGDLMVRIPPRAPFGLCLHPSLGTTTASTINGK